MYCNVNSATLNGLNSVQIKVEISATPGLPQEAIIGLPDTVIKESRIRIKSAIKLSKFELPAMAYTINLAPIDLSKKSPCLELAIAVGLLVVTNQIRIIDTYCFLGSLSLKGSIEPIRAILPLLYFYPAKTTFVIPKKNIPDIQYLAGLKYKAISHLTDLRMIDSLAVQTICFKQTTQHLLKSLLSFDNIIGHHLAKQACAFAIAGHHHCLFVGSPGIGKTMLINHTKSLQLPLRQSYAIENYCVNSLISDTASYTDNAPFQMPHHTITYPGMIGGQNPPKPGEISLANHGILFLDELGEYQRKILDTLREPMETSKIKISRAGQPVDFPAHFLLFAAMNPCNCGHYFSHDTPCKCRPTQVARYWERISAPLRERFGICVILSKPQQNKATISHQQLVDMVQTAQEIASHRNPNGCQNNAINHHQLVELCQFESNALEMIDLFCQTTSYRSRQRLLALSLTIADCNGSKTITPVHVSLSIQLSQQSQLP